MRVHIIRDGVVANTVIVSGYEDDLVAAAEMFPDATVVDGSIGGPGWIWDGSALWPPGPPTITAEQVTEARRQAYAQESDHLFVAWQASVATDAADQDARKSAWLAARAAVQARLPYPT